MDNRDSLSLVHGQSTVTCMIVTYLSQLTPRLHHLVKVGIGQCNHQPMYKFLLQVQKQQQDSALILGST
jgi:hypothetical protein